MAISLNTAHDGMFLFAGPHPQLQFAVWENSLKTLVCCNCNLDLFSEVRFQCEGYFGPVLALWLKMVPNLPHWELSQDSTGEIRVSVLIMWSVNTSVMFTPNIYYYLNRGWEQGVARLDFNSCTGEAEAGRAPSVSRPNWSMQGYVVKPSPITTVKWKMFIFVYICLYNVCMHLCMCSCVNTHMNVNPYLPSCLRWGLMLFVTIVFMPGLLALEFLGNSTVCLPSHLRSIAIPDTHQHIWFTNALCGDHVTQQVCFSCWAISLALQMLIINE